MLERVFTDRQSRLLVSAVREGSERAEVLRAWRAMAEAAWLLPGHPGWAIVNEHMELVDGDATPSPGASYGGTQVDPMEGVQVGAPVGIVGSFFL